MKFYNILNLKSLFKVLNSSRRLSAKEKANFSRYVEQEKTVNAWILQQISDKIGVTRSAIHSNMLSVMKHHFKVLSKESCLPFESTEYDPEESTLQTKTPECFNKEIDSILNLVTPEMTYCDQLRINDSIVALKVPGSNPDEFMKRYGLVNRRISGSGRAFKPDAVKVTVEYLKEVRKTITEYNFQPNEIINFDESSFYMDSVGNYSVASNGTRKNYAKTTGKEKVRLSCLMTSTASGHKSPVLCVVPRKKKIDALENNLNDMIIIY